MLYPERDIERAVVLGNRGIGIRGRGRELRLVDEVVRRGCRALV
jgi:hypothetical protein